MTKEKVKNYTDEMVATMEAMYTGADNKAEVKAIAAAIDKTESSVRSKLGSLGRYVTEIKVSKTKGKTKSAIATEIGGLVPEGFTDLEIEGLVKATAGPLAKILDALTVNAAPAEETSEETSEE